MPIACGTNCKLTGTHLGCEHGVCGACTVIVDGAAVRSCLMLAVQADGASIVTVEGLSNGEDLSPLQAAFRKHHALQCGFCTPGILTTAHALLTEEPDADADRIREVLSGNICRCTGYIPIVEAVLDARAAYGHEGRAMSAACGRVGANTLVGQPVERVEDLRFLRGQGQFADDYEPAGVLHAAILRSSVAHGRIRAHRRDAALASARRARRHHGGAISGIVPRIPLRLAPIPGFEQFLQPVIASRQGPLCRRAGRGRRGR